MSFRFHTGGEELEEIYPSSGETDEDVDKQGILCEIWGYHNTVDDDSRLLWYDTMHIGKCDQCVVICQNTWIFEVCFSLLLDIGVISFTNFNTQFLYSLTICMLITILDMFRALTCPSSGGQIILSRHLVSPLSVNGCTVCQMRADWRLQTKSRHMASLKALCFSSFSVICI